MMDLPTFRAIAGFAAAFHYRVSGDSMEPTYRPGDILLVDRMSMSCIWPSRGDVIVLLDPRDHASQLLKRVVAVQGDKVEFVDGILLVNGDPIDESYLHGLPPTLGLVNDSWDIQEHSFFVLGDNRAKSTDSRKFGPFPANGIVGRVKFRYWPVCRW